MKPAVLLCIAVVAACHAPAQSTPSPTTIGPDTLRGIVVLVGNEPGSRAWLESPGARAELLSSTVRFYRLVGLDVVVTGGARRDQFDVRDYVVRASHGRPALDGILGTRDGVPYLRLTEGGERPLAGALGLPASLMGSRIWLVLADDGGVVEFGALQEPAAVP